MYSKEQIEKALEKYEETGSIVATIIALGYPSRANLHRWIKNRNQPQKEKKKKYSSYQGEVSRLFHVLYFTQNVKQSRFLILDRVCWDANNKYHFNTKWEIEVFIL